MDYRLDIYNAIERWQEERTEDDALFVVCHNSKQGDLLLGMEGDVNILSQAFANDNNYVLFDSKEQRLKYERARSMVLNIAINILRTDEDLRYKFKIAMNNL